MKIGAGEHPLAPTFGAYDEIERALDSALSRIYEAHFVGGLQLVEMAQIVTIGMNAAKPDSADLHDVAGFLFEQGPQSEAVRRPIAAYLLALAWSPEDAAKKLAAEWPQEEAEDAPPPTKPARKRRGAAKP